MNAPNLLPATLPWDCGGDCIFGERRGDDRDCDECWANCVVSLPGETP